MCTKTKLARESLDFIGNRNACHPERVHPVLCVATSLQRTVSRCMEGILRWFHAVTRGPMPTRYQETPGNEMLR